MLITSVLGGQKRDLIEIIGLNVDKYAKIRYIYDAINHHENEPYPTALRRILMSGLTFGQYSLTVSEHRLTSSYYMKRPTGCALT